VADARACNRARRAVAFRRGVYEAPPASPDTVCDRRR
jgi:hypothetical protein